jgi:hypothetical protein
MNCKSLAVSFWKGRQGSCCGLGSRHKEGTWKSGIKMETRKPGKKKEWIPQGSCAKMKKYRNPMRKVT